MFVPGIGGEHFTSLAYNPDVSPYVYAMFSTFEELAEPQSQNKLFILDPAADANPYNVLGERLLTELDLLNLTAKEIALDADGNLFIGAFSSEIYFIEDVVTNPASIDTAEPWYSSSAFSFDTGLDIGFAPPEEDDADYNEDGTIDAADYVAWRKFQSQFGGEPGYQLWKQQFGQASPGAGGGGAVPEPAGAVLLAIGIALFAGSRRIG
jgi:hypothetical protein